jgi:TonB family protein
MTRTHEVEIPSGQSASIGLLFDEANNRGHLVAISMLSLALSDNPHVETIKRFLGEKNTMLRRAGSKQFLPGDQQLMDKLFGAGAPRLPIAGAPDTTGLIEFDTPPRPVGGMQALANAVRYPPSARQQQIEGRVLVKIRIDTTGKIIAHDLLQGVSAALDSAAIAAILNTPFDPARKNGRPVAVWVTIPIQFKLD